MSIYSHLTDLETSLYTPYFKYFIYSYPLYNENVVRSLHREVGGEISLYIMFNSIVPFSSFPHNNKDDEKRQ